MRTDRSCLCMFAYNRTLKTSPGTQACLPRMDSCPLPIELCEAIMDAILLLPEPLILNAGQPKRKRFRQRALCNCALTCRAWRPRAQHLLRVHPNLATQQSVLQYLQCMRNAPAEWAPLASEIRLQGGQMRAPPTCGRDMASDSVLLNVSRASALFTYPFPRLRILHAATTLFDLAPRLLRMRLPFFAGIARLVLVQCVFDSVQAMLELVWACPSLTSLVVVQSYLWKEDLSLGSAERLLLIREYRRGCEKLENAFLRGLPFGRSSIPLPGGVFGSALTSLTLTYRNPQDARALKVFLHGAFPVLASIDITITEVRDSIREPYEPPCILRMLAEALSSPHLLRRVLFQGPHDYDLTTMHDNGPACCQRFVGTGDEDTRSAEREPIWALLSGLQELEVRLSEECAALCGAYITTALPGFGGLLLSVL
ncbi:hypothetical protein C8Q77DRAFT_1663 [Trametes polyzona]|nr:hypothetical protein C8Q77DRAFT_1663 [Trametes polyzona]